MTPEPVCTAPAREPVVQQPLPQTIKPRQLFPPESLAVIGLHTVFEHHAVMNPAALEVFNHEYRLTFPIGVDEAHRAASIPLTMQAYGLHGTPSVVLSDRRGRVRLNHFGHIDDMAVGGLIGQLIAEPEATSADRMLDHSQSSPAPLRRAGTMAAAFRTRPALEQRSAAAGKRGTPERPTRPRRLERMASTAHGERTLLVDAGVKSSTLPVRLEGDQSKPTGFAASRADGRRDVWTHSRKTMRDVPMRLEARSH